jgi:hypothetical protein
VDDVVYGVKLSPGKFSESLKATPYIIRWDEILYLDPAPASNQIFQHVASILKEALSIYGLYGEKNLWPVETYVIFGF